MEQLRIFLCFGLFLLDSPDGFLSWILFFLLLFIVIWKCNRSRISSLIILSVIRSQIPCYDERGIITNFPKLWGTHHNVDVCGVGTHARLGKRRAPWLASHAQGMRGGLVSHPLAREWGWPCVLS